MMDHGRIDVGVPVYRGGEYVAAALQSLVDQTYKNFSVLISVDGGDTESAEICRPFLSDPRFRLVVQNQRLGWAGNLNWLVSQSDGAFFCYYQQDDLTAPNYFERLIGEAARNPGAAIVFSDLQFFGDDRHTATARSITGDVFSRLLQQLETFSHTPVLGLIRTQALRAARDGLRLTKYESFGEDFVWVLKLARAGDLINVPELLYFKRRHAQSTSGPWFDKWSQPKRRDALITFCVGLLDAVLPGAQTNVQRFQLLYMVLERLALHQWFYLTKRLSHDERRDLVTDFIAELRTSAETDIAQAFEIDWSLLTSLSLRRFGLEIATKQSVESAEGERAIEVANRCLEKKLRYRLGVDIDFSDPKSRKHLQGDWGGTEPWGVWTHGPVADLLLWPEEMTGTRLFMLIRLKPFLDNVSRQRLDIYFNDVHVAFFQFNLSDIEADRPRLLDFSLPSIAGEVATRPLRISFTLPGLATPQSFGLSEDAPVLGMGFLSARIYSH